MQSVLIVGAGLTGAVVARELALAGFPVTLVEARSHIAGNCYTYEDQTTGITVHKYGPHIFHTSDEKVWNYVSQFCEMMPYICRVKATTRGGVFSLPINLLTINQFYGLTMSPVEAREFIRRKADGGIIEAKTFEEQALKFVGRDLYEAFFKGYPEKQWGLHPRDLPASVLKRLPLRFNYDDNYFDHAFQGIPRDGYTNMVEKVLNHPLINVSLNTKFDKSMRDAYRHVFFSGPLDSWFDFSLGRLGYRTLDFEQSLHVGDYQGCAVMSYPEAHLPYTRVSEHKHFTPWKSFDNTLVYHEYSRQAGPADEPYYPIRLANEEILFNQYIEIANKEKNVSFVGRLGTYRYLDMDVIIGEALSAAHRYISSVSEDVNPPVFFHQP